MFKGTVNVNVKRPPNVQFPMLPFKPLYEQKKGYYYAFFYLIKVNFCQFPSFFLDKSKSYFNRKTTVENINFQIKFKVIFCTGSGFKEIVVVISSTL